MKCIQCGSDYTPKNNEQRYCSGACKSKASRERRRNNLSDLTNQSLTQIPVTSTIVTDIANTAVSGAVGQLKVPSIAEVVNTLKDPSVSKTNKLILAGCGVAGGIVGYQFAGKGRRLGGTILGVFLGVGAGKIVHWLMQDGEIISDPITLSDIPLSPHKVLTSAEISMMEILTISFSENTALGQLVGETLNERFSILLYGEAGGGKSHLATRIAGELGGFGNVLYILAEEEITDSVKKRVMKYNCGDSVKFCVCNKEEQILEMARGYNFLVLDSLNGMSQWNYHTDFLRKVKALNLRGLILLNQVNKNGDVVGNNSFLHEVDVSIKVTDGMAETIKNRFGVSENTLPIFDKTHIARKII